VAEPQRIQLSRARGYRMPEGAVKVDRSTRWGNIFWPGQRVISPGAYGSLASPYHGSRPSGEYGTGPRAYSISRVRDAAEAVRLFASYVEHDPSGWPREDMRYELGGRSLACWCTLPAAGEPDICHAAVLLSIASAAWALALPSPEGEQQ
jgi:hypothetical protein